MSLHGFYVGLERLFALVNSHIDRTEPGGANWHQTLLRQMAVEIPHVRPAVISSGSYELLDEYRGFRHVVRNVYTFHFDPARIKRLVEQAPVVFNRVRPELAAFADFLQEQAETQGE